MPATSLPDTHTGITADILRQLRRRTSSMAGSRGYIWEFDKFTISGSTDTTKTLTYLPFGINNISLNGVVLLHDGTDVSVNYTTGVVTLAAAPTSGDVLSVSYVTTGELIAGTMAADTGLLISDTFNRANSSTTVNPASDGGTWTPDNDLWGIDTDQAYATGTSTTPAQLWAGISAIRRDSGVVPFDIQGTHVRRNTFIGSGAISGLFGSADPFGSGGHRHAYGLLIGPGGGPVTLQIAQLLDGTTGSGVSTTVSDWTSATFRLAHDGAGNLTAYMNGSVVLSWSDTSGFGPLGTWVGVLDRPSAGTLYDVWDYFQAAA